MSVSPEQLKDFARVMKNHPAYEEVKERVSLRIFDKFKTATNEERCVLGDIMNAGGLFYKELNYIVSEVSDEESINE